MAYPAPTLQIGNENLYGKVPENLNPGATAKLFVTLCGLNFLLKTIFPA